MTTGEFIIEKFYLYFQGMMLFQVIFFGVLYFMNRRKEVLYYCLLNFIASCYFFINAPDTFFNKNAEEVFNSPYYLYANFALFLSLTYIYGLFLKSIFKDTFEINYVAITYKITVAMIPLLYALFVIFSLLDYSTNAIFYLAHQLNALVCIPLIYHNYNVRNNQRLILYSIIIIFIFVTITMLMTMRYNAGFNSYYIDKYPLLYIRIGMFIDIILYQIFLMQNWNEQEKQLATKDLQSQLTVERLRNEISNDLHDDIGSSLTKINLKSYMLSNDVRDEKQKQKLDSIRIEIASMSQNLKDIVWSINADKKGFDLHARIRELINDLRDSVKMKIEFMDDGNQHKTDNLQYNHNLYLITKEAINNAIKYSACNRITISLKIQELVIEDNGVGFQINNHLTGNGLKSMRMRSETIGGKFYITSLKNKGTRIEVKFLNCT